MLAVGVGVDERHDEHIEVRARDGFGQLVQRCFVQFGQNFAVSVDPLVDFEDRVIGNERCRSGLSVVVDRRAVLVGDRQNVTETTGCQKTHASALTGQDGVRGHRRTVHQPGDLLGAAVDLLEPADNPVNHGFIRCLRCRGDLPHEQFAVILANADVGESAAGVNGNVQSCRHVLSLTHSSTISLFLVSGSSDRAMIPVTAPMMAMTMIELPQPMVSAARPTVSGPKAARPRPRL